MLRLNALWKLVILQFSGSYSKYASRSYLVSRVKSPRYKQEFSETNDNFYFMSDSILRLITVMYEKLYNGE